MEKKLLAIIVFVVIASLSITGCTSSTNSNQAAGNTSQAASTTATITTSASASASATPTATLTATPTPTPSPSSVPTSTPTPTPTPSASPIATDISIRQTSIQWATIWVLPKNAPVTANEIVGSGTLTVTLNGQVASTVSGGVTATTFGIAKNGTIIPGTYTITATYSGTDE